MDVNISPHIILFLSILTLFSSGSLIQKHCCEIGRQWYEDNAGSCPTHPLSPFYSSPYQRGSPSYRIKSASLQLNPSHHSTQPHSNHSHPPVYRNACIISLEICCTTELRKQRCKVGKNLALTTKGGSCSAELLKKKLKNVVWVSNEDSDVKECCNCCKLGLRARHERMSCDSLEDNSQFTCQCKQAYRKCCLGKSYIKNSTRHHHHHQHHHHRNLPHLKHKKIHHRYNHGNSKHRNYNYKYINNHNHNHDHHNHKHDSHNDIDYFSRDVDDDNDAEINDDHRDRGGRKERLNYDTPNNSHRTTNNDNRYNFNDRLNSNDVDTGSIDNRDHAKTHADVCSKHQCPAHYHCVSNKRLFPVCVRLRHYQPSPTGQSSSSSPSSSSASSLSDSNTKTSPSSQDTQVNNLSADIDLSEDEDFNMEYREKTYKNWNGDEVIVKNHERNIVKNHDKTTSEGGKGGESIKDNSEEVEGKTEEKFDDKLDDFSGEKCEDGFEFNGVSSACEDVDECVEGGGACEQEHMQCKNTPGSYKCQCKRGFTFNPRFQKCQDSDECKAGTHDCTASEECFNREGSYECLSKEGGCARGFKWNGEAGRCEDIDECDQGTHNCTSAQECVNHSPHFACSTPICPPGFSFEGDECLDIDECLDSSLNECGLKQRCLNTPGSYRCEDKLTCDRGFKLNGALNSCEDVDECTERKEGRGDKRRKRRRWSGGWSGSGRSVGGRSGGRWDGAGRMGQRRRRGGINEGFLHNCTGDAMVCVNTMGGFECTCEEGFTYDPDTHQCVDVDECSLGEMDDERVDDKNENRIKEKMNEEKDGRMDGRRDGGIDKGVKEGMKEGVNVCASNSKCHNTRGSFKCQCLPGFTAHSNVCKDIDECSMGIHSCAHVCLNTWGSYKCGCSSGFTTDHNDPNKCIDIDECREGWQECGEDGVCVNVEGGYHCVSVACPIGFERIKRGTKQYTRHSRHSRATRKPIKHRKKQHFKQQRKLLANPVSTHSRNPSKPASIRSFGDLEEYKKYLKSRRMSIKRSSGRYKQHNLKSYKEGRPQWMRGAVMGHNRKHPGLLRGADSASKESMRDDDAMLRGGFKGGRIEVEGGPDGGFNGDSGHVNRHVRKTTPRHPHPNHHKHHSESPSSHQRDGDDSVVGEKKAVHLKGSIKFPVLFSLDMEPGRDGAGCTKTDCNDSQQCTQSIHWKLVQIPSSIHPSHSSIHHSNPSHQSQPTYPIQFITIVPPISEATTHQWSIVGAGHDSMFDLLYSRSNEAIVRILREMEGVGRVDLTIKLAEMEDEGKELRNHLIHFIINKV